MAHAMPPVWGGPGCACGAPPRRARGGRIDTVTRRENNRIFAARVVTTSRVANARGARICGKKKIRSAAARVHLGRPRAPGLHRVCDECDLREIGSAAPPHGRARGASSRSLQSAQSAVRSPRPAANMRAISVFTQSLPRPHFVVRLVKTLSSRDTTSERRNRSHRASGASTAWHPRRVYGWLAPQTEGPRDPWTDVGTSIRSPSLGFVAVIIL